MLHHHVTRPNALCHGTWSANTSSQTTSGVLVQLTQYSAEGSQTRILLDASDALALCAGIYDTVRAACLGNACKVDQASSWSVETGREAEGCLRDEILLTLHDDGSCVERSSTSLALPIADALEMVDKITAKAADVMKAIRADGLSRMGRSPA